jgi:hypothetical protein
MHLLKVVLKVQKLLLIFALPIYANTSLSHYIPISTIRVKILIYFLDVVQIDYVTWPLVTLIP